MRVSRAAAAGARFRGLGAANSGGDSQWPRAGPSSRPSCRFGERGQRRCARRDGLGPGRPRCVGAGGSGRSRHGPPSKAVRSGPAWGRRGAALGPLAVAARHDLASRCVSLPTTEEARRGRLSRNGATRDSPPRLGQPGTRARITAGPCDRGAARRCPGRRVPKQLK